MEIERYSIAMVCDFFYPNMGGVEMHIYQLSQCLIDNGHKVIMITHAYGEKFERQGVRYMPQGLKVYYVPFKPFYNQCIFPTLYSTLPLIREILIRESIEIVHGHSAFSALAIETMTHARGLGLTTVFTDHSLFGFADVSSILTNKLLEFSLSDTTHVICVSHTSKENTVLRAFIDPKDVSVIPNAVDPPKFTPDPSKRDPNKRVALQQKVTESFKQVAVTIVVVSRLVYRKGADLLIGVIPKICAKFPDVQFSIVGDGPKRLLLEELREEQQLHSRVRLFGSLPNDKIRDIVVQGDIFLNTSLTEAFCIAIVEAVCCGLQVVSTNVGGIPEVIPSNMIRLADASVQSLTSAVMDAISSHKSGTVMSPEEMHERIRSVYTWPEVMSRTEKVYQHARSKPKPSVYERLQLYYSRGAIAGKIYLLIALVDWILLCIMEWIRPAKDIDRMLSLERLRGIPAHSEEACPGSGDR